MRTPLTLAIDALSDPGVPVQDALRRLLVVARRMHAEELTTWLNRELGGYAGVDDMPPYRQGGGLPIELTFDGPAGSRATMTVTAAELPEELAAVALGLDFREPVAELQALSAEPTERNPELAFPMSWVELYRRRIQEGGPVPSIRMMVLNRASAVMPRTHLAGILDRIRTTALDLALSIEEVDPDTGDAGGPTVTDDPRLADQVHVHLTQLYAPGSTITVGDHATVATGPGATATQVHVGDVTAVLDAARGLLDDDAVTALAEALDQDGGTPGDRTRSFLGRVRAGTVGLAAGVSGSAAYDGLLLLLGQAFPGAVG